MVVAASPEEVPRLQSLFQRGQENGLRGLRLLTARRAARNRAALPRVWPLSTFRRKASPIIRAVCETLAGLIRSNGGHVVTGARVTSIRSDSAGGRRDSGGWRLLHAHGETPCDWMVTCAGLHSDRVAALTGRPRSARIVPFRGEYYLIRPERQFLVRNLIYPVPDPLFPFLGVHFTRMMRGGVEAGPNAVLAFAREGYRRRDVNLADVPTRWRSGGLWRFLRALSGERAGRSCGGPSSKELFCRSLQRLVPEIQMDDLLPGGSGVRAQAMSPEGALLDDFEFVEGAREIHVVNAPSPGGDFFAGDRRRDRARCWREGCESERS